MAKPRLETMSYVIVRAKPITARIRLNLPQRAHNRRVLRSPHARLVLYIIRLLDLGYEEYAEKDQACREDHPR